MGASGTKDWSGSRWGRRLWVQPAMVKWLRLFTRQRLHFNQNTGAKRLVISKTLKMTGRTHANSRFERDIGEAAPSCFLKFCIRVQFTCNVHANNANSLALSRTVQVNCTVHGNSASNTVRVNFIFFIFLFFLVCIVFVYFFFKKKTSFTLSCKQYFFS